MILRGCRCSVNRILPNVPGNVPISLRQPSRRSLKVRRAHDVVPVEDAPRLVAGDAHRDPLRDPGVDQVPDGRPAEVVP